MRLFRPSSISRILGESPCYASALRELPLEDVPSEFAQLGTMKHTEAETILREGGESDDPDVQVYVEYIDRFEGELFVEHYCDLSVLRDGFGGTADAIVYDHVNKHLHVFDLKTGRIEVRANNPQLKVYALGFMSGWDKDVDKVTLHIVQPPIGRIDTYDFEHEEQWAFMNELTDAMDKASRLNNDFTPTEDNCRYCKYMTYCPALAVKAEEVAGEMLSVFELSEKQMTTVIKNKKLIENWMKSVSEHAAKLAQMGVHFEGMKLVEGRKLKRWTDDAEAVLEDYLGDEAFDVELKSQTEIFNLLREKFDIPKTFMKTITYKPEGEPELVPLTDKRKSITIKDLSK